MGGNPKGRSEADWRGTLTPEQYRVLREHGIERPGISPLNREKRSGIFCCGGCGLTLFSSDMKFESGTGWPTFRAPFENAVETIVDHSCGTTRTEGHYLGFEPGKSAG